MAKNFDDMMADMTAYLNEQFENALTPEAKKAAYEELKAHLDKVDRRKAASAETSLDLTRSATPELSTARQSGKEPKSGKAKFKEASHRIYSGVVSNAEYRRLLAAGEITKEGKRVVKIQSAATVSAGKNPKSSLPTGSGSGKKPVVSGSGVKSPTPKISGGGSAEKSKTHSSQKPPLAPHSSGSAGSQVSTDGFKYIAEYSECPKAHSREFFTPTAERRHKLIEKLPIHTDRTILKEDYEKHGITDFLTKVHMLKSVNLTYRYSIPILSKFYASLSPEFANPKSRLYGCFIFREKLYKFRPFSINAFLERLEIDSRWTTPSAAERADDLTVGTFLTQKKVKSELPPPSKLSAFYGILHRLGMSNWIANRDPTVMDPELMHLIFRLSCGEQVNLGKIIFADLCKIAKLSDETIIRQAELPTEKKFHLSHPCLIYGMLHDQGFIPETAAEKKMKKNGAVKITGKYLAPHKRVIDLPWLGLFDRNALPEILTPPSTPKSSRKRKPKSPKTKSPTPKRQKSQSTAKPQPTAAVAEPEVEGAKSPRVVPRGFGPTSNIPSYQNPHHPIHSHRAVVPSAVVQEFYVDSLALEKRQVEHVDAYNRMIEAQEKQKQSFKKLQREIQQGGGLGDVGAPDASLKDTFILKMVRDAIQEAHSQLSKRNLIEVVSDDGEKTDEDIFEGVMNARDKGKGKMGDTTNPGASFAMPSDGLRDEADEDVNVEDVDEAAADGLGERDIFGDPETDTDDSDDSSSDDGFSYEDDEEELIESPERDPSPTAVPQD